MSLPLPDALRICQTHLAALQQALSDGGFPISAVTLADAGTAMTRVFDQAVLRYLKLQDTLGEHVLRAFAVQILGEPLEDRPMLDVVNQLERLGYLTTERWTAARALRNQLTHDYPEDRQRQVQILNQLPATCLFLEGVLQAIQNRTAAGRAPAPPRP